MPSYTNPQNLNRYSYVTNNPVRYIDPTGHRLLENEGGGGCSTSGHCPGSGSNTNTNNNQNNNDTDRDGDEDELIPSPGNNNGQAPPPDGYYCQGSGWHCWANFTQDVATTIDFIFAGVEVVFVIEGCAAGGPVGCGGGLLASWAVFNSGPNMLEASMSGTSLLLTAVDDYTSNGELGESTGTAFTTFLIGGMSPDPVADLIIDGYASGYNHGFFNSVGTILNGGPLLQSPGIYK